MSLGDKHIDRRVKFFPVFRVLERRCEASFRASTPPSFAASSASSSSSVDRRSQPAVRSHPRLYIVLRRKRNHRRRLIDPLVAAPAVMKGPENDPPSSNSVDKRRARTHAHALAIYRDHHCRTHGGLSDPRALDSARYGNGKGHRT